MSLPRLGLIFCAVLICYAAAAGFDDDYTYDNYDEVQPVYTPTFQYPSPPTFESDSNTVTLPNGGGYVRGKELRSAWTGKNFKAFLGLKYGSVGSGLARFQKAQPAPTSTGVIEATSEPMACPSFPELKNVMRAEQQGINVDDCLTLSVFTPNFYVAHPVMVYVHGEMLFDGSGEEAKPEYMLEKDIVLVTINYRLAPFGFMSTQTDAIPGNVALADLEMALQWVQDNIEVFGGDRNSITLFGQAGGATLAHALSLSERVNPINFDRLILQSGTALNPMFIDEEPLMSARAIGREARCPQHQINSPFELSQCLGRLNTSELLTAFLNHANHNEQRGVYSYGGYKLAVGDRLGYIPVHPALMLKSFKYPVVAGMTKDAGAFILTRKYDELMRINTRNITDYINVVLKYTTVPKYYMTWRKWALDYIFSPQDIQTPVLNNLAGGLLELINLILYKAPLLESIKSSYRTNATYLYIFDYRGQYHRFPKIRTHYPYEIDANLSDENMYLFPYPDEVSRLNSVDRAVAQSMVGMWTNFAAMEMPDVKWPRVNNEFGPFIRINKTLELDYHFGEGIPPPDLYRPVRMMMDVRSSFN